MDGTDPHSASETIRVYVGTDRSQQLGVRVLEHSIRKHSSRPVSVQPLSWHLPEPENKRNVQRTGFSFARFTVPKLTGYCGKAIYMDADMLVFKDINELWSIPFNGSKILVQSELPHSQKNARDDLGRKRVIQNSVSLMDCSALSWDINEIVSGLDHSYSYADLMYNLCIVEPKDIGFRIPYVWNSLEHWDNHTCNLHYTDMNTQPWVSPKNRIGYLWINELKEMLDNNNIAWEEIVREVALGYARPSLLTELKLEDDLSVRNVRRMKMLSKIDREHNFVKHRELKIAQRARYRAQLAYLLRKAFLMTRAVFKFS